MRNTNADRWPEPVTEPGPEPGAAEPWICRVLDRIFPRERINGRGRCPTYLHRWRIAITPSRAGVYLHRFIGGDWSRDHHDHPKRFISIGLWGSYVEEYRPVVDGVPAEMVEIRYYRAPWIRTFPAEHVHRLLLAGDVTSCWTLVVMFPECRKWGFWTRTLPASPLRWLAVRDYLQTPQADDNKAC